MKTEAIQAYEAQGTELLVHAESICIVDDITRELATEFTTDARKAIKTMENEFRPDIEKAHTLHKDLLARLNRLIAPFKAAKTIVDKEIGRDYLEQEKVRLEEERKARKKADAERKVQEDALTKEAERHIAAGDLETAETVLDSEVVVNPDIPVAPVQQTTRSTAGSATARKDIKVELVDKQAVIIAVFGGHLPADFLDVNLGAAKRYAKANGVDKMPGFRITETVVVSGRVN